MISVKDIVNEPLALFGQSHFVNKMVTEAFHNIGATPNIVLISRQIDTLKRFVVEKLASTVFFEDCVFDSDPISKIYVKEFPTIYVGIGWKKKRTFTEEEKKFIRFAESLACKVDM